MVYLLKLFVLEITSMIDLFKPYMPELPELHNILMSGKLSYSTWGSKFESSLGNYIGNPKVLVVNSYNSSLLVLIKSLELSPGEEVIASPMSCLASNQPFITMGIKIKWADVDPSTGTLCPDSVKQSISTKTKAIVHNHHCGYPGYVDEIVTIARENGLFVIDDAIEAFGSEYKNEKIGNLSSDATVFSFQTVRLPNSVDGGAITFKDNALFEKAIRIRDYGIDRKKFRNDVGEISSDYDIIEPGFGSLLSEPNSYIGYVQMQHIKELISKQRFNAKKWTDNISEHYPKIKIINKDFQNPNYWIYGILTNDKRSAIMEFRKRGYNASTVHYPNNRYSLFGNQPNLPGVTEFYDNFIALPCGWWFSKQ